MEGALFMLAVSDSKGKPVKNSSNPQHSLWKEIVRARWPYLFIFPFYLTFLIFGLYSTLFSFYLSFTEWKGLGPITFIGLKNYISLFRDKVFIQSMENGFLLFFMYVPLMIFLALVLAVILNSKRVRGFQFFRTIIFIPYIMNIVAAGFAFRLLLNQKYGVVNNLLVGIFNIAPIPWLESVWGGRVTLCLLIIWAWLGYNMVIMLAGLQTIPSDLTEAAMVDGASPVQAFFRITIPLMRPVILFSVVLSLMGSFNLFNEVYILTGGGPMNATITPFVDIFGQAFGNFRLGYASAMAYVYFIILFILTLFQVRYFGSRVD
jgi:lactose/L-arabinose transport system permease protein